MGTVKPQKFKIMVFAGAGASAGLGMPTTPQFVKQLTSMWPGGQNLINQCRKYRQSTGDKRKDNAPIDAEELRDWLLRMEMEAETLDSFFANPPFDRDARIPKIPAEAHNFVKEIRTRFDEIVRTKYGAVDSKQAYNHYSVFFDTILESGVKTVPFFTTNYDLVIESLGDSPVFKWRIETGVVRKGTSSVLDMSHFKNTSRGRPTINLFKLHGSTDWWLDTQKKQIEFLRFGAQPPPNYDQLLIYPTRVKFEQVSDPPYSLFYDKLKTYLSSRAVHTCIVIGYSFRDTKINELFIPAMKRGLRLLVFDMDAHAISQQIQEAFLTINIETQLRTEQLDFGTWDIGKRTRLTTVLKEELEITS